MRVNTRHTLPWLNPVTLCEGEELGQRRSLCFIRPRVYTAIPIIHKATCWELRASCSLSACLWLLGWNEGPSSPVISQIRVYRDGIKALTALFPSRSVYVYRFSVHTPYTSQTLYVSVSVSDSVAILGPFFFPLCGCLFEISPSLSKVPFAGLAFHNVNSLEAFLLPQWVFLDAGPSAKQNRSSSFYM